MLSPQKSGPYYQKCPLCWTRKKNSARCELYSTQDHKLGVITDKKCVRHYAVPINTLETLEKEKTGQRREMGKGTGWQITVHWTLILPRSDAQ